jgi:translation elongation factor EF-Tu-like GTPase
MKANLLKITAQIEIIPFEKGGRKTNIISGYRPTFYFIESMGTSGALIFYDRPYIEPIGETEVDIYFPNDKHLGDDFDIGKEFVFKEGGRTMGKGIVLKIHGYVARPQSPE